MVCTQVIVEPEGNGTQPPPPPPPPPPPDQMGTYILMGVGVLALAYLFGEEK